MSRHVNLSAYVCATRPDRFEVGGERHAHIVQGWMSPVSIVFLQNVHGIEVDMNDADLMQGGQRRTDRQRRPEVTNEPIGSSLGADRRRRARRLDSHGS